MIFFIFIFIRLPDLITWPIGLVVDLGGLNFILLYDWYFFSILSFNIWLVENWALKLFKFNVFGQMTQATSLMD